MFVLLDPHEKKLPLLDQAFLVTARLLALPCGLAILAQHAYHMWRAYSRD